MQILYFQFYVSGDFSRPRETLEELSGVKATLGSLSDDSLWYGSWVPDLLRILVKAGDIDGAIEIVGKLKEPIYRGIHYGDVAGMVVLKNDSDGVERIINLVSEDPERMVFEDLDMVDMVLGDVARQHAWAGGNLERAKQYAARISGEAERKFVSKQIEDPPPWCKES